MDTPPDAQLIASSLHAELLRRGELLASAESLTGGELGAVLSGSPGASETYVGGVITYATGAKLGMLGVREETVAAHGVVSAQCAAEMAEGARERLGADWAVSTTGVAGPTTQEGKPVGTVFVGVAGPGGTSTVCLELDGDRAEIRSRTCYEAMSAVLARVVDVEGQPMGKVTRREGFTDG